jgi:hypothetical protein
VVRRPFVLREVDCLGYEALLGLDTSRREWRTRTCTTCKAPLGRERLPAVLAETNVCLLPVCLLPVCLLPVCVSVCRALDPLFCNLFTRAGDGCMRVCVCLCVYVCMCLGVCVYVCVCVRVCTSVCTRPCLSACLSHCLSVCRIFHLMCVSGVCVCVCVCVCVWPRLPSAALTHFALQKGDLCVCV